MSETPARADAAARSAMLCAGAMVAQQVAAKSARDALFLSSFPVAALPVMLVSSALVSMAFVVLAARAMRGMGPRRLVPLTFVASGGLLLGLWGAAPAVPRAASVALYLHVATFGSILISGFWLLVSERFDPRTARRRIGRIAGSGTIGGLVGGLAAERVAAWGGIVTLLPILALLHLLCAWLARALGPDEGEGRAAASLAAPDEGALRRVAGDEYLRTIAAFVVVGSVGGALTDYLFKAQAAAVFHSPDALLRFFAAFYTGTGVLALLVQMGLGRRALERLGLAGTAATLPLALAGGGLGVLLAPGLPAVGGLRGVESVLRGSLYRLGYELLYTPLPAGQKRPVKGVVDVALDRLGDAVGGLVVRLVLWSAPGVATAVLSALVVVSGLLGLYAASKLRRGYVRALEKSLLSRAVELGPSDVLDSTTRRTVHETLGVLPLSPAGRSAVAVPALAAVDALDTGLFLFAVASEPSEEPAAPEHPKEPSRAERDPLLARLAELRSGDPARVRRVLEAGRGLDPLVVPQAIRLLAWDDVANEATRALRGVATRVVGQLVDVLLDTEEEFAVRRRLPRVLAEAPVPRAVSGLLAGLRDRRFEVRLECGRALHRITERVPSLAPDADEVFATVLREADADRALWESRGTLDASVSPQDAPLLDDLLGDRVDRSLEHVFTLLSLALPREPLRVAFRALHTGDTALRGTALEYLESVLPAELRERLMPFLDPAEGAPPRPLRPREEVLAELMRSHSSIELRLSALREEQG